MNRYFKILGPLIIGISAVIPIVSCRSVDTPLTPSERYSIKGDSTFRNIYRDDDFASENEILWDDVKNSPVEFDNYQWLLSDLSNNALANAITVNECGQIVYQKSSLEDGSYNFELLVQRDEMIIAKKNIVINVVDIKPAPENCEISGPIVIHALKNIASNVNPHNPMDEGAQFTSTIFPATASQDVEWSIRDGSTDETANNPYHTEYVESKQNNKVPSWLSINKSNGKLSWTNEVVSANDPLVGRYLNWRFTIRCTSKNYLTKYWDYPINFMVSKRTDGWVNPTSIDINTKGWFHDFKIDTNLGESGSKQYYSIGDAGISVLTTDVFQNSVWELTGDVPGFVDINRYGELSWTNNTIPGAYKFDIKATSTRDMNIIETKEITFNVKSNNDILNKINLYLNMANQYYEQIQPIINLVGKHSQQVAAVNNIVQQVLLILNASNELYQICKNISNNVQVNTSDAERLFNLIKTLINNPDFITNIGIIVDGCITIKTIFNLVFSHDKKTICSLPFSSLSCYKASTSNDLLLALSLMIRHTNMFILLVVFLTGMYCTIAFLPFSLIWLLFI